jgi:hypothetical protein
MPTPLRRRPLDLVLVACYALFAFTSLVMEMYIVFGVDLRDPGADPFARAWAFYCRWDPLFYDTPTWLRIMCGVDGFVFGPFYLVLIWALVREREWIRVPALVYVGAIVYSTLVYFGYEFVVEAGRANLAMVVLVNVPYTIMPLVLAWRVWPRNGPAIER